MLRRRFIQLMTVAGAGGLATLSTLEAGDAKTVAYGVKGFICVACAVGLETLLRQEKGVVFAKACYPDASVVIRYQPATLTEDQLRRIIADMGYGGAKASKLILSLRDTVVIPLKSGAMTVEQPS